MRHTPDANILVRAVTSPTGSAQWMMECIRSSPDHVLVLSEYILTEVRRVLLYARVRDRYGLGPEKVELYLHDVRRSAEMVEPFVTRPVVLSDPADDMVLYTAVEGQADVLCTGNLRHFGTPGVRQFCAEHGIRVMTDVEVLREMFPRSL